MAWLFFLSMGASSPLWKLRTSGCWLYLRIASLNVMGLPVVESDFKIELHVKLETGWTLELPSCLATLAMMLSARDRVALVLNIVGILMSE